MGFFAEFTAWLNRILATYIADSTSRVAGVLAKVRGHQLAGRHLVVVGPPVEEREVELGPALLLGVVDDLVVAGEGQPRILGQQTPVQLPVLRASRRAPGASVFELYSTRPSYSAM